MNGLVVGFGDVRTVMNNGETVEIMIDRDTVPARVVEMETREEAETICLRLVSSLGMQTVSVTA